MIAMQIVKRFCIVVFVLLIPFCALSTELSELPEEFVLINKVSYLIPSPWHGHKVEVKTLTVPPLMQIPHALTENQSNLFLLDEACLALIQMAEEAEKEAVFLKIDSSYRSSWYQKKIFIRMMEEGRDFNDIIRYVAPPGYSEHALGTVVDFTPSNWRFAATPAYKWLQENANSFGFFETLPQYPKIKTPWEAWHWRYLGLTE